MTDDVFTTPESDAAAILAEVPISRRAEVAEEYLWLRNRAQHYNKHHRPDLAARFITQSETVLHREARPCDECGRPLPRLAAPAHTVLERMGVQWRICADCAGLAAELAEEHARTLNN